jgi:SpoIID/LytB domain protein
VLWSREFAWTRDGLPLVTVRIAEGLDEVTVAAPSGRAMRLLPDGEGGARIEAGGAWRVALDGPSRPAQVRWHVVVASGGPSEAARLREQAAAWRERGFAPRTLEVGSLFGVKGEVVDARRLLVGIAPHDDEAAAREEAKRIAARFHVETSLQPEVADRPRGTLVARDERGTVVRNDGVIWFQPVDERGVLEVSPTEKAAPRGTGLAAPRKEPQPSGGAGGGRRSYAGAVYVTVDARGKLAAVNAVADDRLLAGLLPAEMGASAPPEALKAQAVAARNELLAKMGNRHLTDPYRLCATTHCQVYAGAGREDARATAAVAATRGELLTGASGGLVDAVYSGSCGGHTEDNERAWGGAPDPQLRGVLDAAPDDARSLATFATVDDPAAFLGALPARPYCDGARGGSPFRWSARVEAKAIGEGAGVGALRGLEVLERGVSGRAVRVKIVGERGEKEVRGELSIRRALGDLKSALFTFTVEKDAAGKVAAIAFRGGGHGHGIGMCQSGAMGMAERGASYRQILEHYYRGAKIRKLY